MIVWYCVCAESCCWGSVLQPLQYTMHEHKNSVLLSLLLCWWAAAVAAASAGGVVPAAHTRLFSL